MDWFGDICSTWLTTLQWLAGLTVLFAILGRLTPCNPGKFWWYDARAWCTDLMYWFVVPIFLRLVRMYLLVVGVNFFYQGFESSLLPVRGLPIWQQCLLVHIGQDFALYWIHRFFHTSWAWKFHAVHHSPQTLDWTTMSRFHPVNHLLAYSSVDIAVLLLGFDPATLLVLTPINIVYSAMVHANLNWTFGPFKYLLASPVFHRWHHTTEEEGIDLNFAPTYPIFDLLFGTFSMPIGTLPTKYGVTDPDFPEDFLGQLIYPFLPARNRCESVRPSLVTKH